MVAGLLLGLVLGAGLTGLLAARWSRRSAQSTAHVRRRANVAEAELAEVVERAHRLEGALDLVGEGIVIADLDGRRLFTNAAAGLLTDARHEEALVAAAVDTALAEGLEGRTVEQGIELFGRLRARSRWRPPRWAPAAAVSAPSCWSGTSPASAASRPSARSSWPT